MAKVLTCECGLTVRGDDDNELIARARDHLRELHPDVAAQVSDDDLLAMSEEDDVQV